MGDSALWLWLCASLKVLAGLCWCVVWCWGVFCQCGCVGMARAVARGHLGWRSPGWRALRLRSVCHVVVGWRGGVGGERGWERGALHDPIVYNDSSHRPIERRQRRLFLVSVERLRCLCLLHVRVLYHASCIMYQSCICMTHVYCCTSCTTTTPMNDDNDDRDR